MMKLVKQRLLAEVKYLPDHTIFSPRAWNNCDVCCILILNVIRWHRRFLRKRYKSMSENPSQTIACRVKNRSMPPPAPRAAWAVDVDHRLVHAVGSSSRSLPVQRRQLGPPRAPPVIDLNEACEPVIPGVTSYQ
jgi:hypothetical protein